MEEVREHVNEEAEYEVSNNEIRHFRQMIEEVASFMYDMELLDEYGEIDENKLDEVCEAMGKSYEEQEW